MASRKQALAKRASRVRRQIKAVANGRPRLSVARSHKNISAQIIDDEKGITLASASTLEKDVLGGAKTGADTSAAAQVGKVLAERAKKAGVEDVVFDRGGYMFHGRVRKATTRGWFGAAALGRRQRLENGAQPPNPRENRLC